CVSVPPYSVTYNGGVSVVQHRESFDSYDFTIDLDVSYTSTIPDAPVFGSIKVAQSCVISPGDGGGTDVSCTYATTFQGDEALYTVSDVEISGDDTVGYSLSGNVSDDSGNEYTFVATQITFCLNGHVQSGDIEVTVNGEVIAVNYPNCNEMIVTYKGESRTISQIF
ncbi:MAG: hypothetical protein ACWGPN_14815, partial [Gammaproteobacteria bacterium]